MPELMETEGPKGGRVVRRVLLGLCVALAVAYGVGVWWFGEHWVPGATVNGIDVGGLTDEEVAPLLADVASVWQGKVTSPGGFLLELDAEDVGLTVDGAAMAAEARARENVLLWPWLLANPPQIQEEGATTTDAERVAALVDASVATFNETAAGPTDATLAYDEESGAYVVMPSALGTKLDVERVQAAVGEMVASLGTSLELGDDMLVAPGLREDDPALVAACEACNGYVGHDVVLVWEGEEVARADAATIHDWVDVADDWQVTLDDDAVREWVDDAASDAVSHQDDLHYFGLDLDLATEQVVEALSGGEASVEVALADEVVEDKPPLSEGAEGRGRHLDVNLTTQYARFYDGSSKIVWESYIVTGDLATGHDTPTGDFKIMNKQRARTLVGADEDHDGEPDYRTYVEYWMLFRDGGYGLHDAPWRSSFGGDIYTYAGSHGCINLPPSKAASLYGLVNVGDRVYVHW